MHNTKGTKDQEAGQVVVSTVEMPTGPAAIKVICPLPPSDNGLYAGKGYRFLTRTGAAYKNKFVSAVTPSLLARNPEMLKDNRSATSVVLYIYFTRIETKEWTKSKKGNRFLKIDITNRHKLVIDALADATGIDDRNHMDVLLRKREDQENPRIELLLIPGQLEQVLARGMEF